MSDPDPIEEAVQEVLNAVRAGKVQAILAIVMRDDGRTYALSEGDIHHTARLGLGRLADAAAWRWSETIFDEDRGITDD